MATALKLELIKMDIKQWRLARILGISEQEVSHYVNGRRRCPADMRRKMATALNTPVEKLFPNEEDGAL